MSESRACSSCHAAEDNTTLMEARRLVAFPDPGASIREATRLPVGTGKRGSLGYFLSLRLLPGRADAETALGVFPRTGSLSLCEPGRRPWLPRALMSEIRDAAAT